jgi:hypothetical protein
MTIGILNDNWYLKYQLPFLEIGSLVFQVPNKCLKSSWYEFYGNVRGLWLEAFSVLFVINCPKNPTTQNLDDFIYVVILPNFCQTLAQPTDHLQKWPTHLWRVLFILYTPNILSFGLDVLKMKFFTLNFTSFWRIFYNKSHVYDSKT